MPSPTDFNLSPYFDDFTESKKFHRVLFRPANAVQARELTQSQTILQNQIERFGDHIFDKGAMVIPGEVGYDLEYYAVKLTSIASANTLAQFTVGTIITGGSSGVRGEIINSTATDGSDPDTLFVKYLDSGTSKTATAFSHGETITGTNSDSVSLSAVVATCHTGSAAGVQEGVYYINGFHVQVSTQTLILDKYSNTPSYRVGLTVTESFVTSSTDATLNDNAAGSSNVNAPGAHRFKIDLTLAKKTIASTEDSNFVELLRLSEGILQNRVRTTDYSIIEETFARRTFDESGDYTVRNFDIDIREHLKDASSSDADIKRGIFTAGNGGLETKLAVGLSPGKAYVKGFEIEKLATTYLEVDKARDFDTEQNFGTRFDVGNFINVTQVHGQPDIGFVSGSMEAFKAVNLYKTATASRGTEQSTSGVTVPQIGRAKSRGFEYSSGTAASGFFSSSGATSNTYKHFLFDINMFTHLNILTAQAFTTGETVTGGTSGATGTVQSISTTKSATISGMSSASPSVVTATAHTFEEGQQVTIASVSGLQIDSTAQSAARVFTVRNPATNTFQLFDTDGTTPINVTAYTSGGTAAHGVVVVSNVSGDFAASEVITGGTSSNTATIQANAVGKKGVTNFDIPQIKQLGQPGTPVFTADADLSSTSGSNVVLTGTVSVANSGTAVTGFNTRFNSELKVGDSISFTTDGGTSLTRLVEAILSDSSLTLSAAVGGSDVSTKTIVTRRRTKIQEPEKNISIFKLPYETIKTLKTTANGGASDTNFKVRRNFVKTLTSNGDETITAGTNEVFSGLAEKDFTVTIRATGSGGTGAVGDVMALTGNNHEGDAIFTLSGSPTGKTLKFDFGANFAGHTVEILATVTRSIADSKSKTLNSASTLAVSTQATIESGTIGLGKADIFALNSIFMAPDFSTAATTSHTNITDRFELDNGQRDNFYDIGRIKLKTGELTPTGRLLINFDFFSHGAGDFFDVDSYDGVVTYENIPSYTSATSGEVYELRDTLDFRPRVDDASTINSGNQDRSFDGSGFSTVDVVKFGNDVTSDFEYFLKRVDKIYIDKEGNFKILKGASALRPDQPGTLDNAMHLYTLFIPSYTLDIAEIGIEAVDNRRYTMRDIGRLEKRIQNVEYYTQLSLLEASAQSLQIQDANGFDRFKNGFIVDDFTGHNIGDPGNPDYKIAVDYARGEIRPTFNEDAVKLIERDDDGTAIVDADRTAANYQKTGDLITLPYTETTLIEQPYASKAINVNPFGIFTWIGSIVLTPPNDEWKETERAPDLVINNDDGTWDTLVKNSGNPNLTSVEMGTVWNEWQNHWTGVSNSNSTENYRRRQGHGWARMQRDIKTTTRTGTRTRTGIRQVLVPKTVTQNVGDRLVSIAFVPFIRSRTLTFSATRMKPNTRVFPFFDEQDITAYVTPTSGSLGGNLVTDANGAVSGTFAIPDPKTTGNPRWRTGQRVFRLTSSSTNDLTTAPETAGNAEYQATGVIETVQNTIISTRTAGIEFRATNETENVTQTSVTRGAARQVGYHDPLAQTFMIDDAGGVFLTSIDLYFSTKDAAVPVTVQIRETVNGYPGQHILPFSEKSLNPSAVNTSTDGTTATKFTFDSPVYLQENTEYSFVVMANSTDYNAYVARLGETNLTSDRTISQQPYAGVMFKSQNGVTWTADQNEDMKFLLRRAEFSQVTGTVTLTNDTLPTRTLKTNPLRTTNSSKVIRVFHPNHGMHGTSNNVTIAAVANGTYNNITHDKINGTYTSLTNVTLDSYDITSPSSVNANATGDVGGATVTATQNRLYDVLNLGGVQTMQLPGTSISHFIRPTTGKSVHGSESEFVLTSADNKISVVGNDNIYFTTPQMVASEINETNETIAGGKSLYVIMELQTTNTKISPVIDTQRMSAFTIQNRLNNPTNSNTPSFVADTANTGTSTAAVYCTKSIGLETSSTSLDIRLSSNVRSSSSVRVYFRTLGPEDDRSIEDLTWTAFNSDGSEDTTVSPSEDDTTFREYKYSVGSLSDFTTFQIKIEMVGSVSSYPPVIKDMRAIALAV